MDSKAESIHDNVVDVAVAVSFAFVGLDKVKFSFCYFKTYFKSTWLLD